jgi:hypothetical protein
MPAVKALSWCRLWNAMGTGRGGDTTMVWGGEEVEAALQVLLVRWRGS